MPRYTFQDLQGNKRVLNYPMSNVPPIGVQVIVDGKRYIRVPDWDSVSAAPVADRNVVSRSLPRNYEHHAKSGGKFDAAGRPLFTSQKQIRETTARSRGEEPSGGYAYE